MAEFISNSLEETKKISADIVQNISPNENRAKIVGLYGELGSGKTTFMKYFAEALGVKDTIQSPTFVIEKIYELNNQKFKHLIHIDAYRLESAQELEKLGWREIISDPTNLICIEWPERVAEIMLEHIIIKFEHAQGENPKEFERKISIT